MKKQTPKNIVCIWYDKDALAAAKFYAKTFPNSKVTAVHKSPADFPSGKKGQQKGSNFALCTRLRETGGAWV